MTDQPFTHFLGYDLRLSDDLLKDWAARESVPQRADLLPTSFDRAAAPEVFVADGQDLLPGQIALGPELWSDSYWQTFGFFRNLEDAYSCLADPAPPGIGLYAYWLMWFAADFPNGAEPLGGMIRAMEGDEAQPPDPDIFCPVGVDALDQDGVSILHLYAEKLVISPLSPEDLDGFGARHALDRVSFVHIERCRHPYWCPEQPLPRPD